MPKKDSAKPPKRSRGRPAIGRPYLVRLEPQHVAAAQRLANGNISEGVRLALERAQ